MNANWRKHTFFGDHALHVKLIARLKGDFLPAQANPHITLTLRDIETLIDRVVYINFPLFINDNC